jgi:hypothetical protein
MKFELTEKQLKQLKEWQDELEPLKVGGIGGGTWFMFCPTGLGNIVKVRREDGQEIDLTDTDSW